MKEKSSYEALFYLWPRSLVQNKIQNSGAKLTNNKCLWRKGGYRRSNKKKNDIKARQILFSMNNARNPFVRAFCYLRCIIDISK